MEIGIADLVEIIDTESKDSPPPVAPCPLPVSPLLPVPRSLPINKDFNANLHLDKRIFTFSYKDTFLGSLLGADAGEWAHTHFLSTPVQWLVYSSSILIVVFAFLAFTDVIPRSWMGLVLFLCVGLDLPMFVLFASPYLYTTTIRNPVYLFKCVLTWVCRFALRIYWSTMLGHCIVSKRPLPFG